MDISPEMVDLIASSPIICPHLHLSLQSGDSDILKRMNRPYSTTDFEKLVTLLVSKIHHLCIGVDVMVGFPGESEEDFAMTMDLLERVKFDGLFSFKYSDRIGTVAEKMDGKVAEKVKASRLSALQTAQKRITLEKNRALLGKTVEVLVEGPSRRAGQVMGRTGSNKIVNFFSNNKEIGNLVAVKITHAFLNSLRGEIVA